MKNSKQPRNKMITFMGTIIEELAVVHPAGYTHIAGSFCFFSLQEAKEHIKNIHKNS